MLAVLKREIQAYFYSAIGYIFVGVFLILASLYFITGNILAQSDDIVALLSNVQFLFLVLVPILTMKLFSDERRNKSDQLLLTSPVSLWSVVLGKFFAACGVFLITILMSLTYYIILAVIGSPAGGETFAGYLGFFLYGSALISVGVFMSSVTESNVTAAVLTFGALLVISMADSFNLLLDVPVLNLLPTVINFLSINRRYAPFVYGIVNVSDLLYMLSFTFVFLFLTVRSIEKRRWSES